MRSFKEVVRSLVAVSAVGLAMGGCGASDANGTDSQEPSSEPTESRDLHPDMTNVPCSGYAGCPCSPTAPCTQPDTFCAHPANVCAEITPCGNCSGSSSGALGGGKLSGGTHI